MRLKNKPKDIGQILDRTLNSYRLKNKLANLDIFLNWDEVIGQKLAQACKPIKISKQRTLVIQAKNSSWAQEINMMKEELLEKISKSGTKSIVEDIKIVTGSPKL